MMPVSETTSLTDFQRNTSEYIAELKRTGQPHVLTVNGEAAIVVQDAAAYQRLMELAEEVASAEDINEAVADVEAGRTISVEEFARRMRSKFDLPPE